MYKIPLNEAIEECQKQLLIYDTTTDKYKKDEANTRIIYLMCQYPQIKLNKETNKFYV